jgi:hypothetical protein
MGSPDGGGYTARTLAKVWRSGSAMIILLITFACIGWIPARGARTFHVSAFDYRLTSWHWDPLIGPGASLPRISIFSTDGCFRLGFSFCSSRLFSSPGCAAASEVLVGRWPADTCDGRHKCK